MAGEDDACQRCGGAGRRVYGSTATWRGGIGGQTATEDVCDKCWGTGSASRRGTNIRRVECLLADATRHLEQTRAERDEARAEAERLREELAEAREPVLCQDCPPLDETRVYCQSCGGRML